MSGAAATVGLAALFHERARSQPDAPALSDGRLTLSYAQLAERVRRRVEAMPVPIGASQQIRVSVSIGASLCTNGNDWAIWYSEADCLLYEVKGQGGDGCRTPV